MWQATLRFSAVGIEMAVAIFLGYGSGWWLDRKLGTKPYLMIVMLMLGIAAAFRGLIRVAQEMSRANAAYEKQEALEQQENEQQENERQENDNSGITTTTPTDYNDEINKTN